MATMSDLVERLKREAKIEESEGFSDDEDLAVDIADAVARHNPYYTVASLPDSEIGLVMLLAWSKVCLRRATKFAKETDSKGAQGFAADRSTPYTKNIGLAKALEERYKAMADNMGVASSSTAIVQGKLLTKDALLNLVTPTYLNNVPSVKLTLADSGPDYVVLEWDTREYDDFREFLVFAKEGAAIYQKWNIDSATGTPLILDSATRVADLTQPDQRAIKITGVDRSVETNHFLVVSRSGSNKYAYSNEVTVAPLT